MERREEIMAANKTDMELAVSLGNQMLPVRSPVRKSRLLRVLFYKESF